jgi:hypothetical protein
MVRRENHIWSHKAQADLEAPHLHVFTDLLTPPTFHISRTHFAIFQSVLCTTSDYAEITSRVVVLSIYFNNRPDSSSIDTITQALWRSG